MERAWTGSSLHVRGNVYLRLVRFQVSKKRKVTGVNVVSANLKNVKKQNTFFSINCNTRKAAKIATHPFRKNIVLREYSVFLNKISGRYEGSVIVALFNDGK